MALYDVDTQTAARRRFILVVDSDAKSLLYTATLLERFQYSIWTAWTGAEAFEIASIATPALIIASQHLDDMAALDLLRKLRQNERTRSLSPIVLTRGKDPANERACLSAGAVTCLAAPVQADDLYRTVQVAIEPVPRMNIRVSTNLPVSIDNRAVECDDDGCARVLSENGTYIHTRRPYPLNARFPVRIRLAGSTLSADAVVMYTREEDDDAGSRPGMGLQFVQMSSQDQQRIRTFIRNEITRGIDFL